MGGAGLVYITLRVDSFGITTASEFTLIVSVFREGDTVNPIEMRMVSVDSVDNATVTILVDGLSEGTLVFTVASSNIW